MRGAILRTTVQMLKWAGLKDIFWLLILSKMLWHFVSVIARKLRRRAMATNEICSSLFFCNT